MNLELVPITFKEATAFVKQHHRHHVPPLSWKFGVAVSNRKKIVGVAIAGRPIARHLDDGWTLEVTRVCTNGTKNVSSMLYGACRRAGFALGYKRVITYILKSEPGTSLKAAGWKLIGERGGGSWSWKDRPRVDKHPTGLKLLWDIEPKSK